MMMKNMERPPTEILNIPTNCDPKVARKKYKNLIREFTPEHHPKEFEKISNAYRSFTGQIPSNNQEYPLYESPVTFFEQLLNKKDKSERLLPLSIIPASIFNIEFELEKIIK